MKIENKFKNLAYDLEGKLRKASFKPEKKKFTSHLTLARVREPINGKNLNIPIADKLKLLVDRITVFHSELTTQGPIYTVVKEFRLQ